MRQYALRGARRLAVPDRAVEAAFDDAPAVVRADLARLLRDGSRPALAERLLLRLRTERGDRDAALLLPGCSPEFTARMLPELADAVAFEGWSILARRHPLAVLDQAERDLAALPSRLCGDWWPHHANGIAAAMPADPARVLDLLERYGPQDLPDPLHGRLADLVEADPERVARWFADPDRYSARWERVPNPAVLRRLVAAGPPSLPRLAARWHHRGAFTTMVRAVPIAGRGRSSTRSPPPRTNDPAGAEPTTPYWRCCRRPNGTPGPGTRSRRVAPDDGPPTSCGPPLPCCRRPKPVRNSSPPPGRQRRTTGNSPGTSWSSTPGTRRIRRTWQRY
ncbi:hypothetical protein WKI68_40780 [Streptomyces sp. MS1.HAVA.3]|uniref:Uncharacterized protein n=1 Tax=Streptomyces caledonius TaxID=3134107 RepID=A0ABU8UDY3_9ACTN